MSAIETTNTLNRAHPNQRLRRGLLVWTRRALLGLLILLVALGAIGAACQEMATVRDAQAFPPQGQLVDVGGYRLHLYCIGQGSPTVILESGQANSLAVWSWIQPEVAQTTRVCAYDRAGVGWSEPGPMPRDARQMVLELHTLLQNAAVAPPYVLVGHSFGGLVTHVYAAQYPAEVAGLVWLDVEHPEQWTRTPEGRAQYQQILRLSRIGPSVARIGLIRLSNYFPLVKELPLPAADAFKAWVDTTRFMEINTAEFQGQLASAAQAKAAGLLGDMPLVVVTATDHGYPPDMADVLEAQWLTMQTELAALSTNSAQQIVEGATHGSLQVNERDAQVSSAAILWVVEAVRTGKPLQVTVTAQEILTSPKNSGQWQSPGNHSEFTGGNMTTNLKLTDLSSKHQPPHHGGQPSSATAITPTVWPSPRSSVASICTLPAFFWAMHCSPICLHRRL
ncbi:MAG: alpha/beta hydrolase [Caldilineaceae bacterium]